MNFGEWMAVQLTAEQQFEIEKQARSLLNSPDAGTMAAIPYCWSSSSR